MSAATELDELTRYRLLFAALARHIGRENFAAMCEADLAAFARLTPHARAAVLATLSDPGLAWASWTATGRVDLRGAFTDDTLVVLTLARFQRAKRGRRGDVVTWELRP